ncbi:sugar transferase [Siminovitchia acidinfaciens]|uniref:Sugar transferase n=1 Tax=Siminovitchia acidinfaciens TaxID=2321395 RepID=A0A429XW12_9BACI|nr:sugar transferase [Siminovitchia acidinfaciens]RST72562.1 sugar transferase [Siminovitchia acidinfaciens]
MKRMVDLIGASLLVLVFSPILFFTAVAVRISMETPIIFKQIRPGIYGKPFYIYKFRTMTDQRDENGTLLPGRLRLTKTGKFLRKYSLDELPQLFNVIKGDLSLVGPRPLLMEYLHLYTPEQARRHNVKPGITGWAQVNGRNTISWDEKFNYDIWYVDHQSFWLDIKILVLTLVKVIKKEGVSSQGHHSMERYKGMMRNIE